MLTMLKRASNMLKTISNRKNMFTLGNMVNLAYNVLKPAGNM